MWGVQGPRRTRSATSFTKPFVKCLIFEKVACPRRGWERCMMSYECLRRRGNTLREEQCGGRKLFEMVHLPPPH